MHVVLVGTPYFVVSLLGGSLLPSDWDMFNVNLLTLGVVLIGAACGWMVADDADDHIARLQHQFNQFVPVVDSTWQRKASPFNQVNIRNVISTDGNEIIQFGSHGEDRTYELDWEQFKTNYVYVQAK